MVDINLGNACSKIAYDWARKTFDLRPENAGRPVFKGEGLFANVVSYGKELIGITSDGIGTKVETAERTGIYRTLGYDLVAMVADDLAANGFEPANMTNILDVDRLDENVVDSLMKGLHDAAKFSGIAVVGGEIAELGNRISGYGSGMHFNWCATCTGLLQADMKPVTGADIKPGDIVIALKEEGLRSNGFTLAMNILKGALGDNWHSIPTQKGPLWGEVLLKPSTIYAPLISRITGSGITLKGIAHITGGSFRDKLGRVLRVCGYGAILNNIFEPPAFIEELVELGDISVQTAYTNWNMGNGMLIIAKEEDVQGIIKRSVENGYTPKIAGSIIAESEIRIDTKQNTTITFNTL